MLEWGGCQSWAPQRGVVADNHFYSTRYLEITVAIDPDLTYIGRLEHSKYRRYINKLWIDQPLPELPLWFDGPRRPLAARGHHSDQEIQRKLYSPRLVR
jgi:hypothetical protein